MTVETEEDLASLRRIGRIVAQATAEMGKAARPGMTTAELDAIGAQILARHGARPAPRLVYDFPGVTCISLNDEAAHGVPGGRTIHAGDLVNIDVSAELDGYFGDTAVTVPMLPVAPLAAKLCRHAEEALRKAIAVARAGRHLSAIGRAVEEEARRGGFNVIRSLGGHGVGRSIHEEPHSVPNYYNPYDPRRLEQGQVITIEPFLTTGATTVVTGPDGWTLRTPDGTLSAQYEHTIIIRRGEPLVVTALGA